MRNIYLSMVTVEQALQAAREAVSRESLVKVESVASEFSAGRVTAAPVFAQFSSPTFHSAAMDGYAVRARETFAAREGSPLTLRKGEACVPVNTGNPMPPEMDAVIMIEHVVRDTEGEIQIESPSYPWQHVRRIGEDIVATELLLPQNHLLTPYDVGALLSAGIWELDVYERIRLHVIPTGDEVLDFRKRPQPKPGQVVDSNSQVLLSLARSWGCDAVSVPTVPDNPDALEKALSDALDSEAHIVVMGAGSSAGSKDYTPADHGATGGTVLVHGINVMPGKPSLVATARGKLIVGAPGYPVSAVVCHEEIIAPLAAWLGRKPMQKRQEVEVELTRKVPSRPGMREVLRLAVGRVGERYVATASWPRRRHDHHPDQGSGPCPTSPVDSEGLEQGARIKAELLLPEQLLDNTLVIIGSHDNTMDLLANELMGLADPILLASTHVGSMGGIMALRKRRHSGCRGASVRPRDRGL